MVECKSSLIVNGGYDKYILTFDEEENPYFFLILLTAPAFSSGCSSLSDAFWLLPFSSLTFPVYWIPNKICQYIVKLFTIFRFSLLFGRQNVVICFQINTNHARIFQINTLQLSHLTGIFPNKYKSCQNYSSHIRVITCFTSLLWLVALSMVWLKSRISLVI
jgi:hypothetical protein